MIKYLKASLLCFWFPWVAEAKTAFPTSPVIERRAQFWEKIFTRYSSTQIVIHDKDDMHIILGVIDLPSKGFQNTNSPGAESFVQTTMRRYDEAVQRFADRGAAARNDNALAATVWKAYSVSESAKKRLTKGGAAIRGQGGLSDTFAEAFRTSELYLPRMEKIFVEHGLPPELTRIVFVESMFNLNARSKVGASGFWQLMPGTARQYLRVNRHIDERNSPLKATTAAARILRENFEELQNWPLAITAYNHGLGGMKRAVNQTGSKKLSDIITDYRSPSFGFASRNFYAEFLAALRVHGLHQVKSTQREYAEESSSAAKNSPEL